MFAIRMNSAGLYKQMVAFILLATFLAQSFSRYFIIADYYTNRNAYAEFCENKAKPELHCNGKCQLEKKLSAEERKEKQNPARKADIKNIIFFTPSFFPSIQQSIAAFKIWYPSLQVFVVSNPVSDIFHPPQAT